MSSLAKNQVNRSKVNVTKQSRSYYFKGFFKFQAIFSGFYKKECGAYCWCFVNVGGMQKKKLREITDERRNSYRHLSEYDALSQVGNQSVDSILKKTTVDHRKKLDNGQKGKKRRSRIPDRPDVNLNLWSVIKSSVGKDLSKIPMPVTFNEPISMLQRLAENFEYSFLLDEVAEATDPGEKLAYLAAFTVSCYSTTARRTFKPFNPLLGETYEWDRSEDLGWQLISEQVSHHPPISAQYCSGHGWNFWQEFGMQSKFRGQYMRVNSLGMARLDLADGTKYSWNRVNTTVNNIIMGKLWIDNDGESVITDLTHGWKCALIYIPYSYHNKDKQRRINGNILDPQGKAVYSIDARWDSYFEIKRLNSNEEPKVLWRCSLPPPDSEKFYNFTLFACQLNEPESGVAPTDSRRRPDQRLMEKGDFDEADIVKGMLEQKQRATRKAREEAGTIYEPTWFSKTKDQATGEMLYTYNGKYWNAKKKSDWSKCPDIYTLTRSSTDIPISPSKTNN